MRLVQQLIAGRYSKQSVELRRGSFGIEQICKGCKSSHDSDDQMMHFLTNLQHVRTSINDYDINVVVEECDTMRLADAVMEHLTCRN